MRLADRRELLTGKHLSRVQEYALDLLMIAEARDNSRKMTEEFKRAILSADPGRFIPLLYPEWAVKGDADITDEDLVESEGEWKFETTNFDPEDADAMLASLLADNTVTVTAEDVPEEDW